MIFLPALILAQATFTYSDGKGDLSLRARDGEAKVVKGGWQFLLKGSVHIDSRKKGVTLDAGEVTAVVIRTKNSTSPDEIKSAKGTGGVKMVQTANNRTANLQSSTATYTGAGQGGVVQVNGSVRLQNVDESKRQTMVATGSSGSATLDPKSKRGISKATLNGPVRVEVVQTDGNRSKMVFTGNKLTLDGDTLVLSGNVKGEGSALGTFSGMDSVVGKLNDKGELVTFNFKSRNP